MSGSKYRTANTGSITASLCYDAVMRTTLELTTEAYHVAKAVARERNQSLGKVISEFILRRGNDRDVDASSHSEAGFPIFSSGKRITSEDVQGLLEEDTERS
ncbi:MAG: hypothetical protein ABI165_09995 [Bryobacteraceae bacterium]